MRLRPMALRTPTLMAHHVDPKIKAQHLQLNDEQMYKSYETLHYPVGIRFYTKYIRSTYEKTSYEGIFALENQRSCLVGHTKFVQHPCICTTTAIKSYNKAISCPFGAIGSDHIKCQISYHYSAADIFSFDDVNRRRDYVDNRIQRLPITYIFDEYKYWWMP